MISSRHVRRPVRPRVLARPLRHPPDSPHCRRPRGLHRRHHLRQSPRPSLFRGGQADQTANKFLHGVSGGD